MFTMRVKIPRALSIDQLRTAPLNLLRKYKAAVEKDLNATVETWHNPPKFVGKIGQARGERYATSVTIKMEGNEEAKKHWIWANNGVREHIIAAVKGPRLHYQVDFTAKTTARSFSSSAGSAKSGEWIHPKRVKWMPRVEGRHWTGALADKYFAQFGLDVWRAYRNAYAKMIAQANAGAKET